MTEKKIQNKQEIKRTRFNKTEQDETTKLLRPNRERERERKRERETERERDRETEGETEREAERK